MSGLVVCLLRGWGVLEPDCLVWDPNCTTHCCVTSGHFLTSLCFIRTCTMVPTTGVVVSIKQFIPCNRLRTVPVPS